MGIPKPRVIELRPLPEKQGAQSPLGRRASVAPLPANEPARLKALRGYAVLDTAPEPAFDDITLLAAQLCETPMALVSFVDEARQWFKSRRGLEAHQTSRDVAFCAHAILEPSEVFEVPDTLQDERFATNPLVTSEPHLRFYAGAPLVTSEGFALGTLCVLDRVPRTLDEARRKGLQALARQVVAQLELHRSIHAQAQTERMAALGTLAAGMAHEVNNPLAYVISNLDFAAQQLQEAAGTQPHLRELAGALKEAREGAERVRLIVRDLKTFSRVEDAPLEPVDVQRAVDSAVALAWNEIRHRARLTRDCAPVPPVLGHEARLGQVFLNLLVNAAQAIPEGSAEHNEIHVRTRLDAALGRVIIEVSDTGCGIPEALHARILEPFFTTKPPGVGTGLGLSICHGIICELGGELQLSSQEGRGSTFRVVLPAASPQGELPVADSAPTPAPRRGRILVVDDELLVTNALKRSLRSEHDVATFTSARAALEWLGSGHPCDLIFCDLMMPEMTGMDFHAELERQGPGGAERIIFLTGGAFTTRATEFLARVGNLRLEKPFDPPALRQLIREQLAARCGPR